MRLWTLKRQPDCSSAEIGAGRDILTNGKSDSGTMVLHLHDMNSITFHGRQGSALSMRPLRLESRRPRLLWEEFRHGVIEVVGDVDVGAVEDNATRPIADGDGVGDGLGVGVDD